MAIINKQFLGIVGIGVIYIRKKEKNSYNSIAEILAVWWTAFSSLFFRRAIGEKLAFAFVEVAKYLAACHIFSNSSKNLSQYFFF